MTGATFAMAARREAMIDRALHLVGIAAAVVGSLVLLHSVDVAGRPELVMPVIEPVSAILPSKVLWLIALGGVLYTIGVVFHLTERIPYQNAIWHGFVMTAAGIHFLAVLTFVRS